MFLEGEKPKAHHCLMGLPFADSTGIDPASVATPFALRCSVLDCCAIREAPSTKFLMLINFLAQSIYCPANSP